MPWEKSWFVHALQQLLHGDTWVLENKERRKKGKVEKINTEQADVVGMWNH